MTQRTEGKVLGLGSDTVLVLICMVTGSLWRLGRELTVGREGGDTGISERAGAALQGIKMVVTGDNYLVRAVSVVIDATLTTEPHLQGFLHHSAGEVDSHYGTAATRESRTH